MTATPMRRAVAGFACLVLASMGCGIARAIDVHSLGKLVVDVTLKGGSGAGRPLEGAEFDLTCTAPVAFTVRLRTDAAGHATTFARPGKCLLRSRAPVRFDGKSYSWRGNVELFRDRETRVELSDDNSSPEDGAQPRSGGDASVADPPVDLMPTDVLPEIVFKVEPQYPPGAKRDRLRGKVICKAVVGDDGYVRDVEVVSSTSSIFNESAVRAVSQRRYLPAQRSGRAIAVFFTVKVEYNVF